MNRHHFEVDGDIARSERVARWMAWLMGLFFLAASIGGCIALAGCASIAPGADPLVVNVERAQTIATATIESFLAFDDKRRDWMRAHAPEAHAVAEWLRADIGTGPRGIVLLESLQAAKVAYKRNRGEDSRARLVAAFAAVEEAVRRVQSQLATIPITP